MNKLSEFGINVKFSKETRNVKVYAVCCCVDSIARSPMQGIHQWNGKHGYNFCMDEGVHTNTRKYPYNKDFVLRDTSTTIEYMWKNFEKGKPVNGVIRVSPLINLKGIDLISGFVPDHLHFYALGCV